MYCREDVLQRGCLACHGHPQPVSFLTTKWEGMFSSTFVPPLQRLGDFLVHLSLLGVPGSIRMFFISI